MDDERLTPHGLFFCFEQKEKTPPFSFLIMSVKKKLPFPFKKKTKTPTSLLARVIIFFVRINSFYRF